LARRFDGAIDQQLVEPRQQPSPIDEFLVALPLVAAVQMLPAIRTLDGDRPTSQPLRSQRQMFGGYISLASSGRGRLRVLWMDLLHRSSIDSE
jgi:hypothetical protein